MKGPAAGRAAGPAARLGRADVLVAGGCAILAVAMLLLLPVLARVEPAAAEGAPSAGSVVWWAALTTLVAQSVVLVWRRRHPEVVAAAATVAVPVGAVLGMGPALGLTSVALLVAVYALATRRALQSVWPLLAAIGVAVAAGHVTAELGLGIAIGEALVAGFLQALGVVGAPVVVAALVVARRESRSARQDQLLALDRERDALVDAAVARERTAMARELHDIAAHHLTGIAVMSAAIGTQIDTDPEAAKESVGELRRQSTAVLRDLRSLVGLLRDHDEAATADGLRTETLGGITGLVNEVIAGGQDVGFTVFGPNDGRALGTGIGPLAQLAAYRMVQESLANAGRHASGARCEVEIDDREQAALVLEVRNAPAPPTPDSEPRGGLGLVGMRERAELTGSDLDVGSVPGGGWQVRLRIPRAGSSAEAT